MSNMNETGILQVNSENILPIIKKWLYSDTDIFIRELVSNACDAISKLERLSSVGDAELPEDENFEVHVILDKEAGTLTISDNGIGMDFDEVKLYINQIAKSSAAEFIEKYKTENPQSDIIGHFGLGFYSAFMAANTVRIDTLSYKPGATAVTWISDGGVSFEMSEGEKTSRGTDIILTINEESKDFLEKFKVSSVLRKYMQFIPYEIYFDVVGEKAETDPDDDGEEEPIASEDETNEKTPKKPAPINDTRPLWLKNANEITDDEYISFYHKLFTDFNPPLFWIHLNMDYPNRLKGILYFPKLNHELDSIEGQVKLYCNQVYIADNIKEVIPEFLLLLKGVIDCPDLPLNVSRSFLQNDGYTAKLSSYITRKVADKLNGMFKNERDDFQKFWDDISPFIKYGCIKERDFYDKIKPSILFKTSKGEYLTTNEYLAKNESKIGKKIYYATDENQQSRYIGLFEQQETDIALLTTRLDTPFISYIESREFSAEEKDRIQFVRIDAAISDALKQDSGNAESAEDNEKLIEIFKSSLDEKANNLTIEVETLKTPDIPAMVLLSEEARRMQEMSKYFGNMGGMGLDMKSDEKLVLNRSNRLIELLLANESNTDNQKIICEQIYDLAQMSHKQLSAGEMNAFLIRSGKVLELLADK